MATVNLICAGFFLVLAYLIWRLDVYKRQWLNREMLTEWSLRPFPRLFRPLRPMIPRKSTWP